MAARCLRPVVTARSQALIRWVSVLALVIAVLVMFWGCQAPQEERSLARVKASGKLIVGVDPSYPPFAALDGRGQPIGYEIDLAKEVSRRLGVAPGFVGMDFGGIVDALIARKVDVIISGLSPYPAHAKQLAYSRPYFNAGQVLVVTSGYPLTLAGLAGRMVGVESGSTADLEMRQRAGQIDYLQVKSYTTPEAAMEDVRAGRLDAAATDVLTAREYLARNAGLNIAGPPFTDDPYVIASRRGDRSLAAEINRILDDLEREGFLNDLAERWLK